jgi:hypothetical protein
LTPSTNICKTRCAVPNCDSCETFDSCTTCSSGYTRAVDNFGRAFCRSSCPMGQYRSNSSCLACSINGCMACSSATTCTACRASFYLNNSSCSTCSSLHPNCLICDA